MAFWWEWPDKRATIVLSQIIPPYIWMLSFDWLIKGVIFYQFLGFSPFSPSQGYLSLRILYSEANTMVLGKYHARGKIPSLSSLWHHGWRQDKEKKMADDSVGNRFWSATGTEDEICSILNGINSKNTGKSTKFVVKLLRDYCIVKEYNVDWEP